jgi:hypothetical protein
VSPDRDKPDDGLRDLLSTLHNPIQTALSPADLDRGFAAAMKAAALIDQDPIRSAESDEVLRLASADLHARRLRRNVIGGERHQGRSWFAVAWPYHVLPALAAVIAVSVSTVVALDPRTALLVVCLAVATYGLLVVVYASARGSTSTIATGESLELVADQLATEVLRQGERETRLLRLEKTLRVPWQRARWFEPEALADTTGWSCALEDLARSGRRLTEFFEPTRDRRLVVLGDPGAGKSVLLAQLVLDLLRQRQRGEPVPLLMSMSSWDPAANDLSGWLTERLTAVPLSSTVRLGTDLVRRLLDARLIMLVLDGFDEMPQATRGRAMAELNRGFSPVGSVVLACRTDDYLDVTMADEPLRLWGAPVIVLRPPTAADVSAHLCHGLDAAAARRWEPVLAGLDTTAPLAQALRTPLMVDLCRKIYNGQPGPSGRRAPDPAQLADQAAFPNIAAIENHLFDQFLATAYEASPGPGRSAWPSDKARQWLGYLAGYLDRRDTTDLAWWRLRPAAPALNVFAVGLCVAVIVLTSIVIPQLGLSYGLGVVLTLIVVVLVVVTQIALRPRHAVDAPFAMTRYWLAVRGHLPWRLRTYLSDAQQRGVLRQIGGVYQFRNAALQRHLASTDAPNRPTEQVL